MEKIETLRRELLPTHLHTPTHLATPAPTYFAFLPTTMLRCPSPSSRPTPWPLSIRLPSLLAHSRKLLLLLQHWLFLPLLNHAHQHIPKKKKKGIFFTPCTPLTSASFICLLFTAKVFLKFSLYSLSPIFLFSVPLALTAMRYLSPPVHWDHFHDHQWPRTPLVGRTLERYFFQGSCPS